MTPPGRAELVELIAATGAPVHSVLRPILMNRPIVVTTLGTRLCRPFEVVLDILPSPQLAPFAKEDGEPVIDAKGRRVAS